MASCPRVSTMKITKTAIPIPITVKNAVPIDLKKEKSCKTVIDIKSNIAVSKTQIVHKVSNPLFAEGTDVWDKIKKIK